MKFKKEFLQALVWKDYNEEEAEVVKSEIVDTSRWSIIYESVFKIGEKYYRTSYSVGVTESPYEYDDDEIECVEVVPVEKTIIAYEVVK